jgi:hypothetical protein
MYLYSKGQFDVMNWTDYILGGFSFLPVYSSHPIYYRSRCKKVLGLSKDTIRK